MHNQITEVSLDNFENLPSLRYIHILKGNKLPSEAAEYFYKKYPHEKQVKKFRCVRQETIESM